MVHQQSPELHARRLGVLYRALIFAPSLVRPLDQRGDLLLSFHLGLGTNNIGLAMRGGLHFIGRALRQQQRVLQRFFHRFEMADALAQVGDLRFKGRTHLGLSSSRLDHLIEELIDFVTVVSPEATFLNVLCWMSTWVIFMFVRACRQL